MTKIEWTGMGFGICMFVIARAVFDLNVLGAACVQMFCQLGFIMHTRASFAAAKKEK